MKLPNGEQSQLTALFYLNEEFKGGSTRILDQPTGSLIQDIHPITGSCLVFKHRTYHEGASVNEGIKYVLRSDVMYRKEEEQ